MDLLSSVRSQLQRVLGGSRDDSSPVQGTLLGALAASGDLKGAPRIEPRPALRRKVELVGAGLAHEPLADPLPVAQVGSNFPLLPL
jgi:hypothetical protein